MLRQKHIVATILAHARWYSCVNCNARLIEQTDWRSFVNRVERWLGILHCCAHRCACLVSWMIKLNWACLYHFFRRWTIAFYFGPKNSIRLQVLNFLVQFNSLLECISLFHDFSVLDWNHSIVHICWQFIFLDLFLVLKARVSRSKGIHLVTLAYLEAQSTHFVFHELVMEVRSWTWVVTNLLWNAFKKLSWNSRSKRVLRLRTFRSIHIDGRFIESVIALLVLKSWRGNRFDVIVWKVFAHFVMLYFVCTWGRIV